MRKNDLYIDLGTANTVIYQRGRGLVVNQPSVFAVTSKNQNPAMQLGEEAHRMIGRTHDRISLVRPLQEGVIADHKGTTEMLWGFLKEIRSRWSLVKPRLIISLPCQVSEFERSAVKELGMNLGARQVDLLDEPVAAAVGAGLPITGPQAHMVIDIGGGTTEIAIISLGGIVTAQAVRRGGIDMTQAIQHHLQRNHQFLIGEQTAEQLKTTVGGIGAIHSQSMSVGGFDQRLGLPRRRDITSEMISAPIQLVMEEILLAVTECLEEAPAEVCGDIMDKGILLAGGGALLRGMENYISEKTGVGAHLAPRPLLSVAHGGSILLEDRKLFDALERPA